MASPSVRSPLLRAVVAAMAFAFAACDCRGAKLVELADCGCVPEICDGLDNECNGLVDDGMGELTCGTGSCQQTVAAYAGSVQQVCEPAAPGVVECNGLDDDCDGDIDEGDVCDAVVMCPGSMSVPVGTVVTLTATATSAAGPVKTRWT